MKKETEPYQQLVDAIKKMGWMIAVSTENADDETLHGLIIGEQSYIDDILDQYEPQHRAK